MINKNSKVLGCKCIHIFSSLIFYILKSLLCFIITLLINTLLCYICYFVIHYFFLYFKLEFVSSQDCPFFSSRVLNSRWTSDCHHVMSLGSVFYRYFYFFRIFFKSNINKTRYISGSSCNKKQIDHTI